MTDMLHTAFCAEFNVRSGWFAVETDRPVKGRTAKQWRATTLHQFRSEDVARAFVDECHARDIGAKLRRIVAENW
jgi:hypothetical protein